MKNIQKVDWETYLNMTTKAQYYHLLILEARIDELEKEIENLNKSIKTGETYRRFEAEIKELNESIKEYQKALLGMAEEHKKCRGAK